MGVDTRRAPRPPAATDTSTDLEGPVSPHGLRESEETPTSGGSGEEIGTELSRRTDQTHWSIPEDGSPVDIPIRKRRDKSGGMLVRGSNKSQTSLLIEYFEGGKEGPNVSSRPSVRVKVTPSAARKIKDTNEHIRVSESKASRKPAYTRRISLDQSSPRERRITEGADDESLSGSYTSAAEHSSLTHRHPPVEVEVLQGDGSDLSGASETRMRVLASDVSSMPPDSMLEEVHGKSTPTRTRSRSVSKDAIVTDSLKTPSRRRSRSLSKERLAHKAMEKLAGEKLMSKSREGSSGKHKRSSKTRSRSVSNEHIDTLVEKPRRKSSKHHREDSELTRGDESSVLTNSAPSPRRQSGDQYSFRSGTSKSSINANPRLLETVENAIRRLIMPELETLKQEQRMQKTRSKFEQDSMGSTSSVSRGGDISRKLSKHASAPDVSGKPKVVLNRDDNNAGTILSGDSVKGRREHRRARKSHSPSERSFERGMSEETVIRDGEKSSRKRSGHKLRDAGAGAMVGGILTAAALKHHEHRQDMHHSDSRSSLDRKERRRRRSKSHSRSASIAETDEIFHKHDVPPMPMRSDIQSSDITRDSILSERTEEPMTPREHGRTAEVHQVPRGSPREIHSPALGTDTRSPTTQKGLRAHHSSGTQGQHSPLRNHSPGKEDGPSEAAEAGTIAAAAAAGALAAHQLSDRHHDRVQEYEYERAHRGLSPIQSVSSRQESEEGHRDAFKHRLSVDSIAAIKEQNRRESGVSLQSVSSAAGIKFDHSNRPKGMNFEPPEDVLDQHRLRESDYTEGNDREYSENDAATEEWLQREHEKNDRYRDSLGEDAMVDYKRMTNYTDDSLDAPHLNKVAARELQGEGAGRNPDVRGTPVAVESAVASLVDTSIVSGRSTNAEFNYPDAHEAAHMRDSTMRDSADADAMSRDAMAMKAMRESGYGQTDEMNLAKRVSERSLTQSHRSVQGSPRQSIARSTVSPAPVMGATGLPVAGDPMPEFVPGLNSESEISTNPSIIQGPMGGPQTDNRDHWPYQPTPTQPKSAFAARSKDSSAHESLKKTAAGFLGAATTAAALAHQEGTQQYDDERPKSREISAEDDHQPIPNEQYGVNHDFGPTNRDSYMTNPPIPSPPRDYKDEGYGSGPQRAAESPGLAFKDAKDWDDDGLNGLDAGDDPFVATKNHYRHLSTNSGLAQGMGSPLYDSATGEGLDRIPSKDIVALMDHVSFGTLCMRYLADMSQLTVRDAQRNARDTEILVTLVRSAAEMRNSFEEMKKFISEQDDVLAEHNAKQHDRTINKLTIGGPRPQPGPTSTRRASAEEEGEDPTAKKRSIFRRALKGLGNRSQNDIGRIEETLERLLNEVQELKSGDVRGSAPAMRESLDSYNNMRTAAAEGYEPEGQAGTGSTGQSSYFSNSPSRGPSAMKDFRHSSQNRVSTVLEADEELDDHERTILDNGLLTPTGEHPRPGSVPLRTPPQTQLPTGTQSNEHTPKTSSDRTRKHKSNSSSFVPKLSRWSKTTTSSTADNTRNSNGRRERPSSEASRSGELQQYDNGHYSPSGDDRIRSSESFVNDPSVTAQAQRQDDIEEEDRPQSPLIPSEVSAKSEDPKYQAVRNSINLQHPQPRPGPTHRYQHHLESQAQNFSGTRSPISPTSDTFGSDPALARYMPTAGQRYSGHAGTMSPVISEGGYSERSASEEHAPPRPPKIKADDDGPLIPSSSTLTVGPARPPKLTGKDNRPTFASPLSTEHLQPEQRYSSASYESASNVSLDLIHPPISPTKQFPSRPTLN